jgi:hypothetical protein
MANRLGRPVQFFLDGLCSPNFFASLARARFATPTAAKRSEGIMPKSLVPQTAPSIPEHILRIFGDPPLLTTENPEIYFLLLRTIAQEVCPQNVIEWFWVKDFVDLTWEIRRLRRFKTVLMEIERRSRFQPPLRWRPPSDPSEDFLATPWLPSPKPPTKADIRRANRQRDRENAELHTETGSASIFNG